MKVVVATFNQDKALVGAFSVIVQLHRLIVYSTISNIWGLQHKQSHSSARFIVHILLVCCTTIYIASGNEKKETCICILWHKRLFTVAVMVTTNILLSLTSGAWQNFLISRLPNLLQIIYILFWRRCCCCLTFNLLNGFASHNIHHVICILSKIWRRHHL